MQQMQRRFELITKMLRQDLNETDIKTTVDLRGLLVLKIAWVGTKF